jgi:hypothetical protein
MSVLDWFAVLIWPVALPVALASAFLISRHGYRSRIGHAAVFSVLMVLAAVIYVLAAAYNRSLIFLFDAYFGAALAGLCLLGGSFFVWSSKFQFRKKASTTFLMVAVGIVLTYLGTGVLYADYFLPRRVVEGTVTNMRVERCGRCAATLYADIDGRTEKLTVPLFRSLKTGEHVRVESGMGSEYVFSLARTPFTGLPSWAQVPSGPDAWALTGKQHCQPAAPDKQLDLAVGVQGFEPCKQ